MAASAITVGGEVATIEVSSASATKVTCNAMGSVANGGTTKIYLDFSGAGTVATSDAQSQNVVGLPVGCSMPIPFKGPNTSFYHQSVTSASVLYWYPAV